MIRREYYTAWAPILLYSLSSFLPCSLLYPLPLLPFFPAFCYINFIFIRPRQSTPACPAQDDRMALLYTVACCVYCTPGVFIGYALHHFGLAFTRVMGGLMVSGGFLLLSFTTEGKY